MEDKENSLYIPANMKTRMEFFKGYGVKEAVITAIVIIASLPFAYVIYNVWGTLKAIIFLIVMLVGTVIITAKDDNNLCVAKQIGFMVKHIINQKKYKYKYYDKWRKYE